MYFLETLFFCTFCAFYTVSAPTRGKDLTDFDRGRIYGLRFDAEWSLKQVSDKLHIAYDTVKRFCQRSQNQPNMGQTNRDSSGRKRKTTKATDRHIKRLCLADPFATSKEIKEQLPPELDVSEQTIRNRLEDAGLGCYIAATKTQLDQEHKQARLLWAKDKERWTTAANWNNVVFSDESRFDLKGQKTTWVRRAIGTRFNPRHIKNRKNRATAHVMIWGPFSVHGYTPLYRIEGNLNSQGYIDIITSRLIPAWATLLPNGGHFQQDNAPIHVSKQTTTFMDNNNINRIDWPALSPDMNPIENVWGIMAKKLENAKITNSEELYQKIIELWDRQMSDVNYRKSLIDSMPSRVKAMIQARGGPTKY